jgi:hypothetical protein
MSRQTSRGSHGGATLLGGDARVKAAPRIQLDFPDITDPLRRSFEPSGSIWSWMPFACTEGAPGTDDESTLGVAPVTGVGTLQAFVLEAI